MHRYNIGIIGIILHRYNIGRVGSLYSRKLRHLSRAISERELELQLENFIFQGL